MRHRLATALSTSVLALLVAGCGGGGSSGDGGSMLLLDTANHVGAGQAALATGLQFEESSELIVGAQVQRQDDGALLRLALAALRRVDPVLASAPPLAVGLVITSTVRCDNAEGSYVLVVDDADHDNRFDAGDTATFTFSNCVLDGDAANGKVAIRVNALSGDLDGSVYDGRFTVTMTALSLTGSSGSYTGNGALDVDLVGTAARTGSSRVATSGFTSTGRFGSVQSTRTITGFTVNESHVPEGAGERRTLRFEGTLSSTGLEGRSISVATTTPFVVAAGSLYPAQGQAIVSGAFGSTLRLTAVDATSVRFELDANGDGQYEQTSTRPWSELL